MSLPFLCENLADRCGFVTAEDETKEAVQQENLEPVALSETTQRIAGFVTRRPVLEAQEDAPEIDDKRLMRARAGFLND